MKSNGTDALSRFKALEDRIARVLEALAESRSERKALAGELTEARNEKQALEHEVDEARAEIRRLRLEMERMGEDRLKVRNRVQRLISSIGDVTPKKEEKIV